MTLSRDNHDAGWAMPVLDRLCDVWSRGGRAVVSSGVLADGFVFHWHDSEIRGADGFAAFVDRARIHAPCLRLVVDLALSRGDLVVAYAHWESDSWHPDIRGAGARSNFGKIVLRTDGRRILELWQQASDYLYLLGKALPTSLMPHPVVVRGTTFLRDAEGLHPTDDSVTLHMVGLFRRMNDCFLGHCPLSEIQEVQEPDIRFDFDEGRRSGRGIDAWKTFAYALRTASHDAKAVRFDDVFVREGGTLRVFSRSWIPHPSPHILACTNGMVAGLSFEASPSRIRDLHTHLENYIPFLDTDFAAHDDRIRELFRGRRRPLDPTTRTTGIPSARPFEEGPVGVAAPRREVAIVGIAGRFPGADGVEAFWRLLSSGGRAFSEFPADRPHLGRGTRIRHAAFLDGVDRFDHDFFGVPQLLAEYTDPQQRQLMEVIWHALEDSGHRPVDLAGPRTALFVSTLSSDHQKRLVESGAAPNGYQWLGNETAMFPAKLGRWLDVQGPCRFVNAECAGSLVALHEASRLIRDGEVDQAVVGATSLFLHPYGFVVREEALLSPDPAPRIFGADSRGQLRGEAVVAVVLKSLDRALADRDPIHGILAGSAVNGSGGTLSILAPEVNRQSQVIRDAWRDAGVPAERVDVIECQASGVREGDFAEVLALRKAFRDAGVSADAPGQCRLATAKGHVGHAESASGLVALVKLLLEIRHRTVVGVAGLGAVDSSMGLGTGRLRIADTTVPWPDGDGPRVGGINAFATGGYNAHVVVREHDVVDSVPPPGPGPSTPRIIVCSARTAADLAELRLALLRHLGTHPDLPLRDLAHTLQLGREPMAYRFAAVVGSVEELRRSLEGNPSPGVSLFEAGPVAGPVRREERGASRERTRQLAAGADWVRLAEAWVSGAEVDWSVAVTDPSARRLPGLPGYPFRGVHHPFPVPIPSAVPEHVSPAVLDEIREPFGFSGAESFLRDHRIAGRSTLPAAVLIDEALSRIADRWGTERTAVQIESMVWIRPCESKDGPVRLSWVVRPLSDGRLQFRFLREDGAPGGDLLCEGRASRRSASSSDRVSMGALPDSDVRVEEGPDGIYGRLRRAGMDYGPSLRPITALWREAGTVVTRLESDAPGAAVWPVMLDGAIQSLVGFSGTAAAAAAAGSPRLWMPFAIDTIRLFDNCPSRVWCRLQASSARPVGGGGGVRRYEVELLDGSGVRVALLSGVSCRPVGGPSDASAADPIPGPGSAPVASEAVVRRLRSCLAETLKVPVERVRAETPFRDLGMDSALAVALTRRLEQDLGSLPSTLFFEVRTPAELAELLCQTHADPLERWVGAPVFRAVSTPAPDPVAEPVDPGVVALATGSNPGSRPLDIAVIGLAGRYPGARDLAEFWRNLREGRDSITEVPAGRWDHSRYFDPDKDQPGKTYCKWGGFLDGVDEFDARFFQISPWEAGMMDPQERLFLQCAHGVIEDAGYTREDLARSGRVGVFVGVMYSDYQLYGASETALGRPLALFSSPASIANRVSYLCGFSGPSLAVDTMCSSSLTAIHLACQSLVRGEATVALAGGVNLTVHPNKYLMLGQGRFVSAKGRCESFGEGAEGYVPGEGVGVVLLKPLGRALADGDHIYGVIKGSAINHGGRNQGYTVPNPRSQSEVIRLALAESGVEPSTIGYVEAHGTGTALGDPIEVAGLSRAFHDATVSTGSCAIGSVKSNIGHAESAAGIAGLTKVLLQMVHGELVPSLHSAVLNPNIDFSTTPFAVQRELARWKRRTRVVDGIEIGLPRRAGLSSFGAGGSNAHLVIEEASGSTVPDRPEYTGDSGPHLIVLSGRTPESVREIAGRLHRHLSGLAMRPRLGDVAFTLQAGREALEHRMAFVIESWEQLVNGLESIATRGEVDGGSRGEVRVMADFVDLWTSDDRLMGVLRQWIQERNWIQLMGVWVKGLGIDWNLCPRDGRRRIPLPTYPFARDRHWIPLGPEGDARVAVDASPTPASARDQPGASAPVPGAVVRWTPVWDPVREGVDDPLPEGPGVVFVHDTEMPEVASHRFRGCRVLGLAEDDTVGVLAERIRTLGSFAEFVLWAPSPRSSVDCVARSVAALRRVFRLAKALLMLGADRRSLRWTLVTFGTHGTVPGEVVDPTMSGLHGFLGSVVQEVPSWTARLIDLPSLPGADVTLPSRIPAPGRSGHTWAWRRGEWLRHGLARVVSRWDGPRSEESAPIRHGGVYLVIGGAGGIGSAWTADIVRRFGARVVWMGRRPLGPAIESLLDAAAASGMRPEYIQADATDPVAFRRACESIRSRHGSIHGVVHSALVLADATLRNLGEEDLIAAFTAKAAISARIGEVFADAGLDFLLFFSSMVAFTRPPGQSNYAAGSVFIDADASRLETVLGCRIRVMNWAYWGGSGAVASADHQRRMAQSGLDSLGPSDAMPAIDALLSGGIGRMAIARFSPAHSLPPDATDPIVVLPSHPERALPSRIPVALPGDPEAALRRRHGESRLAELDRWWGRLLVARCLEAGVFTDGADGLAAGLDPRWRRWLEETARIRERVGMRDVASGVIARAGWQAERPFWVDRPETGSHVAFAEAALEGLPDVLSGRRRATDVLFPGGSTSLVEGVYRDNPVADHFNAVLAETLVVSLESRGPEGQGRPVRILEIGAGTGGTTVGLLRRLGVSSIEVAEYRFTDLSEAFLDGARRRFGPAHPFFRCSVLDITRPVAAQGIDVGGYDVVVATNVLHATPEIRVALRQAKAALRAGGLLLVNEFIENTAFTHLTFGLLEGWWLHVDTGIRIPGCPGLSPSSWRSILEAEGFRDVAQPAASVSDLGQQVFVAVSDGVMRASPASHPSAVGTPAPPAPVRPQAEGIRSDRPLEARLRDHLASLLGGSLGIASDDIDDDGPFADLGVDSLTGVRFVQAVNQSLGVGMTTTDLFDHASLGRLTRHLVGRHGETVMGSLGAAAAAQDVSDSPLGYTSVVAEPPASDPGEKSSLVPPSPRAVSRREPIAIVGMSGRFARSEDLAQFWGHLEKGTDLVGQATRWDLDRVLSQALGRTTGLCTAGSFLDRIDTFDPGFFNISGGEATYMDPQQRLFLEECWRALEDSGRASASMRGVACGVYVGTNGGDYTQVLGTDLPPQAMWGNSNSVVPARIAYHLDLRGPAIAVDTACSSSLVAVHLACQALWTGEVEMALAGGVFVQASPMFYIAANRAAMLSPTGRCRTFSASADGFVPGEGVGVVVLRRLSDALQDGDTIHAVIEGSGINQDGATNGVTAPSAESQERLERGVYEAFGIRPADIGMVEAHGTGTRLGDPIEFEALSRAFADSGVAPGSCAVGSVKTNLGHATAAAGVTGLLKAVLSLKHRAIPPSLHCALPNPALPIAGGPFRIPACLEPFPAPLHGPRRAAVSAFGFSGTNAHVVLAEAPDRRPVRRPHPVYPFLLGARTAGQLREMVERLVAALRTNVAPDIGDVAFTLQVGRRALEYRMGVVASDRDGLLGSLGRWLRGESTVDVVDGHVNRRQVRERASDRIEAQQRLEDWCVRPDPASLRQVLLMTLRAQVAGHDIDFTSLFRGTGCGRVPLPTYPFAQERYWVETESRPAAAAPLPTRSIDMEWPGRRGTGLQGDWFEIEFAGGESFLVDHVVAGHRVLPAAAYLEVARAAVAVSLPGLDKSSGVRLRDVAWYQPLMAGSGTIRLRIEIEREPEGPVRFQISSIAPGGVSGPGVVHCRGVGERADGALDPAVVDLETCRSRCPDPVWSSEECYRVFRGFGLDYGPSHRPIRRLWSGSGLVLAELDRSRAADAPVRGLLPDEVGPTLLDGALQTIIGFGPRDGGGGRSGAVVPFALESFEILGRCPEVVQVVARRRTGGGGYDIDICDGGGRPCVRFEGFSTRILRAEAEPPASGDPSGAADGTIVFAPAWKPAPVVPVASLTIPRHHILALDPSPGLRPLLRERLPEVRFMGVLPEGGTVAERIIDAALALLEELKACRTAGAASGPLFQVVSRSGNRAECLHGLEGMLHVAQAEQPGLWTQMIEVPTEATAAVVVALLESAALHPEVRRWRLRSDGSAEVFGWQESGAALESPRDVALEGVHLVTGGGGILGLRCAADRMRRMVSGTVVLVGRSPEGSDLRARLAAMPLRVGVACVYRQADVSDASQVRDLVAAVVREFGPIRGLVHAAGVLHDQVIPLKNARQVRDVMVPKVAGLLNLDEALADQPLDSVLLFSAVAGVLGNPGQADYAAANSWMDAFAGWRNAEARSGRRRGRTVSIAWPMWVGGGMALPVATVAAIRRDLGLGTLPVDVGLDLLSRATAAGPDRLLVLHGDRNRIRHVVATHGTIRAVSPPGVPAPASNAPEDPSRDDLGSMIIHLKAVFSPVVKFPPERIDADAPLERLGLDSLMILSLTTALESTFGGLPKTLFFENQTLRELAVSLVSRPGIPRALAGIRPSPSTGDVTSPAPEAGPATSVPPSSPTPVDERATVPGAVPHPDAIAIIGVSGRYPKSPDLARFWDNLASGTDCIEEVPADRWDHSRFFDPGRNIRGKTYAKWGGFLEGVDQFDPGFFRISPREASAIDPQERLFLECVQETLEDAGVTRATLRGDVGVFVGVMYSEYQLHGVEETAAGRPVALPGNVSSIANRVSYCFDFHGPSMAVDTMCSSSLTAIHLACQALRSGDCAVAVAGGVNLSLHPSKYLMLAQGQFASGNGRCESFGRGGDGYVPSEGVGSVLLKPLHRAEADGDRILGVVRGTAINHGGRTHGYTVPNPRRQAEVVGRALLRSGLKPGEIQYIEAHGTGTSLGDPVEIAGLAEAFGLGAGARGSCAIGSVKSNIGHCESAAGIAGVTKVLLQLRHGKIAPSLHSGILNPNIDFDSTPFWVPQQLTAWPRPRVFGADGGHEGPRVAGVSSFGAGGSYAHVLIEEWMGRPGVRPPERPELFLLSARTGPALGEMAARLSAELRRDPAAVSLASVAHTLQVGRESMEERVAMVAASVEELAGLLEAFAVEGTSHPGIRRGGVLPAQEAIHARQSDTAVQASIEEALVRRDLWQLAGFWLSGLSPDWSRLHPVPPPSRVGLPAYPFQRQRCWFTSLTHPESRSLPETSTAPISTAHPTLPVASTPSRSPRISLSPLVSTPRPVASPPVTSPPVAPPAMDPVTPVIRASGPDAETLRRELVASLAKALLMAPEGIDPDRSFVDLGVDSIIGVEWVQAVNRRYGTQITATKVYDHPSVRKFADYLSAQLVSIPPVAVAPPAVTESLEARLSPAASVDPGVVQASTPVLVPAREDRPAGDSAWIVDRVGDVDTVALVGWDCPSPGAGEVQIRVMASALNFPDVLCARGLYPTMPPYPFIPGFEVSGVVSAVGAGVDGIRVGDAVIALTGPRMGGHASRVNVPAGGVVPKPEGVGFEDACSLPVVFGTVLHAFRVGRLTRGDEVLVQTATGGCGLVAIQLANLAGALVYGTAGRASKLEVLERLGVAHRINYRESEFDAEIRDLTSGRGVDVVLNMLSGDAIQRGLNCLAPSGRYLEIAVHGLRTSPRLDLTALVDNQEFHSIDLRRLSQRGRLDGRELLQRMVELLASGALRSIVSRVYPFGRIREALAFVAQGEHIGKVVLSHTSNEVLDLREHCIESLRLQRRQCLEGRWAETCAGLCLSDSRSGSPVSVPASVKTPATPMEPIAVLGMAGQFPQSPTLREFWSHLVSGHDCVGEIPSWRWDVDALFDPVPRTPGRTYCRRMGVLEVADRFDPLFFNISPAEAEAMDPQQRLFLQSCWGALEDAGLRPTSLSGSRCGVFAGCGAGDYGRGGGADSLTAHGLLGGATSILASRISYLLDLRGPAVAIDTACSSSLTAIVQACDGLRLGTVDLALAGGVYVMAGPSMQILTSQAGMLSPDGRCHPFDAAANGFVPGEGVGVIVLKRLSDALRDGDPIRGVIRGWGTNQDGRTNGITAPSAAAQQRLLEEVYARAGIPPASVGLVEAHGTGTQLGDPIEVEALTSVFARQGVQPGACALGSVKGNIGHLMTAAGVAGVIKVLLSLGHRILPPTAHFRTPNPHLALEASPFRVDPVARPWDPASSVGPRRAAVSSFGFSGTNAHVVLEEPPPVPGPASGSGRDGLFVLSARSADRLRAYVIDWIAALTEEEGTVERDWEALLTTVQTARGVFDHRLAVMADGPQRLRRELELFRDDDAGFTGWTGVRDPGSHVGLLDGGPESARFLGELWGNRRWDRVGALWVSGEEVDFAALRRAQEAAPRRRAGLPTYPFAPERYWRSPDTGIASSPSPASPASPPPTSPVVFREDWIPGPSDVVIDRPELPVAIVCVASDPTVQSSFLEAVRPYFPATPLLFVSATGTVSVGHGGCVVVPGDPRRDDAWLRRVDSHVSDRVGARILVDLTLLEAPGGVRDAVGMAAVLRSLVGDAAARWQVRVAVPFHDGLDRCHAESWIGFERSLRQGSATVEVGFVLGPMEGNAGRMVWVQRMADELRNPLESVQWIDGTRCVSRVSTHLPEPTALPLRRDAVYLITGGTGGIGRLLADHLVDRIGGRVVLVSRRGAVPEIGPWLEAHRIRGDRIRVMSADVADRCALEGVLARIREDFGAIHGVFHLAGGASAGDLRTKDAGAIGSVLGPKVQGICNLDAATSSDVLDFFCAFSSISAAVGDLGSCDYSVANRFLAAFAIHRARLRTDGKRSGVTTAFLWPLWASGGMDLGGQTEAYLRSTGQESLASAAGLVQLIRWGGVDGFCPIVMVGDAGRMLRALTSRYPATSTTPLASATVRGGGSVPEVLGTSTEDRALALLRSTAGALMKIPPGQLGASTPFTEFGFDSISLEQWARGLSRDHGIPVSPSDLFAHPTLERLARHVALEHRDAPGLNSAVPPGSASGGVPIALSSSVPARPEFRPAMPEPVAIIGMSGRFPQADSAEGLWQAVVDRRSCLTEVPAERWDGAGLKRSDGTPRRGGFLTDIDRFDPEFFGILPSEAAGIDPRQRLFLEEAWRAFEDAGLAGSRLRGSRCGVFVGVEEGEYGLIAGAAGGVNGNQNATLAARIAYLLDLKGPNLALTAACASGLVALHQACLALSNGDCTLALVGGVNLLVGPGSYAALESAGMVSPTGRAAVFCESADGLVPAESVVALVLKPLSAALADGDPIHGCIRGSAVNYDGRTNGITAPDPLSQAALLDSVHRRHAIEPSSIGLVMAHSVGSRLGDPIEVEAWRKAFGSHGAAPAPGRVASVKPLIGHTFAASGLVNIVVALLAFRHRMLPGVPLLGDINGHLRSGPPPLRLSPTPEPWEAPSGGVPRRAVVMATGISGTNGVVVLEELPLPVELGLVDHARVVEATTASLLVPLSARDEPTLRSMAARLAEALETDSSLDLSSVAFTLRTGREALSCRVAWVVSSRSMLVEGLRAFAAGRAASCMVPIDGRPSLVTGHPMGARVDPGADLREQAEAWLVGASLGVDAVPGSVVPRRVRLPVQPFNRRRHWISAGLATPLGAVERGTGVGDPRPVPSRHSVVADASPIASGPVEERLRTLMRESFGLEGEVDERRSFFEIGMNSINAARFVGAVNAEFGIDLETPDIFDMPTLSALAARVIALVPHTKGDVVFARYSSESTGAMNPALAGRVEPEAGLEEILDAVENSRLGVDEALDLLGSARGRKGPC